MSNAAALGGLTTPATTANTTQQRKRRVFMAGNVELRCYTSSFVQAALALEEATTASMKAMPRMPSVIFG